jgi:hypothetical protein
MADSQPDAAGVGVGLNEVNATIPVRKKITFRIGTSKLRAIGAVT